MTEIVEMVEMHGEFDEPKFDLLQILQEVELEGGVQPMLGDVKQVDISRIFKRKLEQKR